MNDAATSSFDKLKAICDSHALILTEHKPNHWQIRGGRFIVNYYNATKRGDTMYVNGMAGGCTAATHDTAVLAALGKHVPDSQRRHERRGGSSRRRLRIKRQLHSKQNGLCAICQEPVTPEGGNLDHWIPLDRGGSNGQDNLRLTHERCNSKKSNQWPAECTT